MSVSAQDIILHHYEISPFSEKMRKIFAAKNITWFGVIQPNMAPKPELTPLTGGYRRIPVMQMGAHIYCDTELMVKKIEALFPDPPLTPEAQSGVAAVMADWADHRLFSVAAGPTILEMIDLLPPEFMKDRAAMSDGFNPDFIALAAPHMRGQFSQHCAKLNAALAASPFLLGDRFTLADASAFHVINFASLAPSLAGLIAGFPALEKWRDQIRDMGEGDHHPLEASAALSLARDSTPDTGSNTASDSGARDDGGEGSGLQVGQMVRIQADDYGKEVTQGEIRILRHDEIAVLREDPDLGAIMVHYPRAGYRIMAVD